MEILLASIKHKGEKKLECTIVPDWDRISNDKHTHQMYKDKVCDSVEDCKSKGIDPAKDYGLFMKIINQAAKATATKPKYKAKGWFKKNRERLQPQINKRYKLKYPVRHALLEQLKDMKNQLEEQRRQVKELVKDAQANWSQK